MNDDAMKRRLRSVLVRVEGTAGALSLLRHGLGRSTAEDPDSWRYVLRVASNHWHEEPAHLTLSLFALHSQAKSKGSVDSAEWGLGKACRQLAIVRKSWESTERRFRVALSSDSLSALAPHLRSLVALLRGENIPLDYGDLYCALARWESPTAARGWRALEWGRQFFGQTKTEIGENTSE